MRRLTLAICVWVLLPAFCWAEKKPRELKPGINLFSKQQDVEIGKEFSAQVERQMPLVKDETLNAFVGRIGKKLASAPEAQDYPYTFKVIQDKSINAFALPGGPTFTHTGLITAAENEAQIAGVLAHEIAHVALRHGTNNVTKANLIQLPAMIAGQLAGGGWTGTLAQLGIGLGANSALLKFSRNAERDADLLGTRMMHRAGYNPIEMARFFEKLEAEHGKGSAISQFFSDHPNPGNRVKAVQEEIRLLPQRPSYDADSGELPRAKKIIEDLPPPPKGQLRQGGGNPNNIPAARPSRRFREYRGGEVTFQYPDNWEILHQDRNSGEVTIAPRAGVIGEAIGYGAVAGFRAAQGDFRQATDALIREFQQRDSGLQVQGGARSFRLHGYNALSTRLEGPSPFEGSREALLLVTLERPRSIFYMVLIAPAVDLQRAQPSFDRMIDSVRFPN